MADSLMRRPLVVIKARYELMPSLKEVYVEGKVIELYRWFFQAKNMHHVKVYSIDTVEIDEKIINSYGLNEESNQHKLIALSEELQNDYKEDSLKVRCIVDADYDRHLKTTRNNNFLEYTDYTSVEMYFFNEPALDKFIGIVLKGLPVKCSLLIRNMAKVLERVYLIRLSNEKLKWGMRFPKKETLKKYFVWTKTKIEFKEKEFIKNYLIMNGKGKKKAEFECIMKEYEGNLEADARHNIRGHDFTWALFHVSKKIKKRIGFSTWERMESALLGCVEMAFVEDEQLFQRLSIL